MALLRYSEWLFTGLGQKSSHTSLSDIQVKGAVGTFKDMCYITLKVVPLYDYKPMNHLAFSTIFV